MATNGDKGRRIAGAIVHIDQATLVGWAHDLRDPLSPCRIEVALDGEVIGNVLADGLSWSRAMDTSNLDAAFSGFAFTFPHYYRDDKLHLVRVREAGSGKELKGSPCAVQFRERARSGLVPLKYSRDLNARIFADEPIQVAGEAARAEIHFELEPGAKWVRAGSAADLGTTDTRLGGPLFHRAYRTALPYLARFRDVFVQPSRGLVLFKDGTLWNDCFNLAGPQLVRGALEEINAGNTESIQACVIPVAAYPHNYFHWHLDTLTAAFFLRSRLGRELMMLLPTLEYQWQRASLEYLGAGNHIETEATWHAAEVFVACYREGRSMHPDHNARALFNQIKRQWQSRAEKRPASHSRRIYVSRADAVRRVPLNEGEIWQMLEPAGFERVLLGGLPYDKQIKIFDEASVVIATHGAGLTNIGFCRPGTTVVELIPSDYHHGCYRFLSILMGLKHFWIPTGTVEHFTVNTDSLRRLLSTLA